MECSAVQYGFMFDRVLDVPFVPQEFIEANQIFNKGFPRTIDAETFLSSEDQKEDNYKMMIWLTLSNNLQVMYSFMGNDIA